MKITAFILALAIPIAFASCETVTAKNNKKSKSGRPIAQKTQQQKRLFSGF